jgi:hypothetical protein
MAGCMTGNYCYIHSTNAHTHLQQVVRDDCADRAVPVRTHEQLYRMKFICDYDYHRTELRACNRGGRVVVSAYI